MKLVSLIFKFMIPMLITVLVNKISFAAEPAGLILKVSGETNILAASGELREATKKGLEDGC